MRIKPMLPLVVLIVLFVFLLLITIIGIIRNRSSILDKIFTIIRFLAIYTLAFIIGIRPVMVEQKYEFNTKNLDVLFVVDNTISMWAEDYNGNHPRMEAVKSDVEFIFNELAGSNFSLVTFDDTSHILSPYTQDGQYVNDFFDGFQSPKSFYAKGSDLSLPYQDMGALLRSSDKKENRKCIVFYISDGEITNDKPLTDYSEYAQYIDDGAVMGYGSASGGKMLDGGDTEYYIYDYNTHEDALSVIDENNLQKIAGDLGVTYYNMYEQNASLRGAVSMIKENARVVTQDGEGIETFKDTYFWFAIPLAVLMILEILMIAKRGRL